MEDVRTNHLSKMDSDFWGNCGSRHIEALTHHFQKEKIIEILIKSSSDTRNISKEVDAIEQLKILSAIKKAWIKRHSKGMDSSSIFNEDVDIPQYILDLEKQLSEGIPVSTIIFQDCDVKPDDIDKMVEATTASTMRLESEIGDTISNIKNELNSISKLNSYVRGMYNQVETYKNLNNSLRNENQNLKEKIDELQKKKQEESYKDFVNYDNVIRYISRKKDGATREALMSMMEAICKKEDWDTISADIKKMSRNHEDYESHAFIHVAAGGINIQNANNVSK